jgi:hypothetical protein
MWPPKVAVSSTRNPAIPVRPSRAIKSEGIVRDERGQEQPADKERAQQTSKNQ